MCLIPFVPSPLPLPTPPPPALRRGAARLGAARRREPPELALPWYRTHGISRESAFPRLDAARRPWAIALPSLCDATRRDATRRGAAKSGTIRRASRAATTVKSARRREWRYRRYVTLYKAALERAADRSIYLASSRNRTAFPIDWSRTSRQRSGALRTCGAGRGGPWPPSKMKVKVDEEA